MKNIRMTVAYDGTRFYGWQHQPDKDTVSGRIESVLSKMCGKQVELIGAGRTDAGVHAKGMTANVFLDTDFCDKEIKEYLNRYLPDDIGIIEVKEASQRFHARYNATGKTYCYTCFDGDIKPVFNHRFVEQIEKGVDIGAMEKAAEVLLGEHDFRNFCNNPKMKKSTVRNIDMIEIKRSGGYINFTLHGNGFLQNMVRIIVGTLLETGYGRKSIEEIKKCLDSKERMKAGPTAPAKGLCLMSVDYE